MSKILDIANDLTSLESKFSNDTLTGMTFDSGIISNTTVTGYTPTSRSISAGSGISGGGDLSANRTLAVSFSANQSQVKTALNASGSASIYACRAWVNFNGTGTVAIRASGNVSSITDNGTGQYTVNFTTAMPDANYSFTFGAQDVGNTGSPTLSGSISAAPTTSSLRITVDRGNNSTGDIKTCCVTIFR